MRLGGLVYNRGQITPTENFCYVDIGSIDNIHQKLGNNENIITPDKAPSRARKIIAAGDIIYSTVRPYLHNMCIIDREFSLQPIASTGFATMTCYNGIYNKFLFFYLLSPDFDSYANNTDNSKGVAYPAINDVRLYKAIIPIPPLAEQHRIVAKIEELLPYIDKYAQAEKQLNELNSAFPTRLKKSILQLAVQGKLVPQDENDEPASILLERIREEKKALIKAGKLKKDKNESFIFVRDNVHYENVGGVERCIEDEIPFDIPGSWEWCRLGTLFQHNTGKALNSSNQAGTKYTYITTSNLYWGRFELDNLRKMPFTDSELEKCTVVKGDLLVCEGGDIGRASIWEKDYPIRIQNHIHRLRSYCKLDIDFFFYLFMFYKFSGMIGGKGIGIQGLSSNAIHQILLPLPPLSEQHRIVRSINRLLPICDKL